MKFPHFILISFLLHLLSGALFLTMGSGQKPGERPQLTARRGIALELRLAGPRQTVLEKTAPEHPNRDAIGRAQPTRGAAVPETAGVVTRKISAAHWGIRYPPLARAMGKEGRVTVRCRIQERERNCGETELLRSSGFADLDRAALAGVRKYNHFRPLPGQRLLDVTISFRLIDRP